MANLINKIKDSSFFGFALVGAINTGFSFIIYIILSSFIKRIFKFKTKRINPKKQKTLTTFFVNNF